MIIQLPMCLTSPVYQEHYFVTKKAKIDPDALIPIALEYVCRRAINVRTEVRVRYAINCELSKQWPYTPSGDLESMGGLCLTHVHIVSNTLIPQLMQMVTAPLVALHFLRGNDWVKIFTVREKVRTHFGMPYVDDTPIVVERRP